MGLGRASNSACGGGRRCLFNYFSQITFRLISLSVALTPSQGLFICAKDLFVEAKLPGLGQCAARKDLLSGHLSLVAGPSVETAGSACCRIVGVT